MGAQGKYDTSGLIEAQFEPGSRGRVLRNLRGITSKREMDRVEAEEQLRALRELVAVYDRDHRFTAADVSISTERGWGRSMNGPGRTAG